MESRGITYGYAIDDAREEYWKQRFRIVSFVPPVKCPRKPLASWTGCPKFARAYVCMCACAVLDMNMDENGHPLPEGKKAINAIRFFETMPTIDWSST